MPGPSLEEVVSALAGIGAQFSVSHSDDSSDVLVRVPRRFGPGAAAAEEAERPGDRPSGPAGVAAPSDSGASEPGGGWEHVPEAAAAADAGVSEPEREPRRPWFEVGFDSLPFDVRRLAGRLRDVDGWTARDRVCRAVRAGRVDAWVLAGDGRFPHAVPAIPLANSAYIVLRSRDPLRPGPFYGEYADAVQDQARQGSLAPDSVSRGCPSKTEVLCYLYGAGRPLELPPRWQRR